MAPFDSAARKQAPQAAEPAFRAPPHNIEAEQALLGAILVNNEAFYRVSDFLEPKHFFEPVHRRIYELAGGLVRANKLATPVTIATADPSRPKCIGDLRSPANPSGRRISELDSHLKKMNSHTFGR